MAEVIGGEGRTRTAPVEIANTDEPHITFMVIGDQGAGGKLQKRVARGMAAAMSKYGADFVIGAGDNFYPYGVSSLNDSAWKEKFEDVYKDIYGSDGFDKFYMTLGNHDYIGNEDAQTRYTAENKVDSSWHMPGKYYRFDKRFDNQIDNQFGASGDSVAFFALDTTPFIYSKHYNEQEVQKQLAWLKSSLKNSKARWKIVFGHHPPRSNGSAHGDALCEIARNNKRSANRGDKTRLNKWVELLKIIEEGGVKAGFFGHDHHLEALKPVNGVHYFVSGVGGKARDVIWRRNTEYALTNGGFIWARVKRREMTVVIFDKDGKPKWKTTITHPDAEKSETVDWSRLIENPYLLKAFCNKK